MIISWKFCVNISIIGQDMGQTKKNRPIVIMLTHPKFIQLPRVVYDILDVQGTPQESYPESFMSISLLLDEL